MDYKRIFRSRSTRKRILNMLRFVPDSTMLKIQYWLKMGNLLNLKAPKRFTEKLQWYKLYYRNPLMHICVNKHAVREYVKRKGLGRILIPQYAHYKWVEDIEWDKLPSSFVVKTQHGGGGLNVIVVNDKEAVTKEDIVNKLSYKNKTVQKHGGGREWAYWGIPTGVVVEKLLVNRENPENGINDYKFFCYHGHAEYIIVDVDRYIGHKRNFYDRNWKNLNVLSDCPAADRVLDKPENLNDMLEIAETLSGNFPYVRVDLYNIEGEIYFGELTFYPWSGYVHFSPDEWDYTFGKSFELVRYKKERKR